MNLESCILTGPEGALAAGFLAMMLSFGFFSLQAERANAATAAMNSVCNDFISLFFVLRRKISIN